MNLHNQNQIRSPKPKLNITKTANRQYKESFSKRRSLSHLNQTQNNYMEGPGSVTIK